MAVYNLSQIMERITRIMEDGYAYADISETSHENGCPPGLSFLALAPGDALLGDYGKIDSIPADHDFSS